MLFWTWEKKSITKFWEQKHCQDFDAKNRIQKKEQRQKEDFFSALIILNEAIILLSQKFNFHDNFFSVSFFLSLIFSFRKRR